MHIYFRMRKFIPIFFILLSIIFSSCQQNNDNFLSARSSFVKIEVKQIVKACSDGECFQATYDIAGSGAVVKKGWMYDLVLTAGHLCDDGQKKAKEIPKKLATVNVTADLSVIDLHGNSHPAKIIKVDTNTDMCLLRIATSAIPVLKISESNPKIGAKVHNFAAPAGIFNTNMVPILDGRYSGKIKCGCCDAYTLPAAGGSSGSPIVNTKGELIGMIHSVHKRFPTFAFSASLDDIKDFIAEY